MEIVARTGRGHIVKLAEMLHVEVVENGPERCVLRTPVTEAMLQPHGVIHGGISAYLAEHAASECATACSDPEHDKVLGLDLTSTHLLPVCEGDTVETIATPVRKGGRVQVWKVEQFRASDGELFNVSQLTIYVKKAVR